MLTAPRPSGLRLALILAILVSAGLFAIGVAIERDQESSAGHKEAEAAEQVAAESGGEEATEASRQETHSEVSEPPAESGRDASEGSGEKAAEAGGGETPSESSEDILGINPEATGLVIAAVVAAVLLAVGIWLFPVPLMFLAVIAFGVVFAVFDVREVLHQLDESREGVAVIAALVALLHVGAATLAGVLAFGARRQAV